MATNTFLQRQFKNHSIPTTGVVFRTTHVPQQHAARHEQKKKGAVGAQEVGFYKKRLIYSVAGLDRGFAANKGAVLAVEGAIYSLVGAAGGSPTLTWTPSAPHLQCFFPVGKLADSSTGPY